MTVKNMKNGKRIFVAALLACSFAPALVLADAVPPPPDRCPRGHAPRTGHSGPYCQPPPPRSCPPGHEPRVFRDNAYCEPPPPRACPTGSHWVSTSPHDAYCRGGSRCDQNNCYQDGFTCRDSSLCVQKINRRRHGFWEKVRGICTPGGTCADGLECIKAKRCDPNVRRQPTTSVAPVSPAGTEGAATVEVERAGCRVAPRRSAMAVSFSVLVIAFVLLRLRRSPSRR